MPTLELSMIVKNEESNLHRCLTSTKDIFDKITIIDTGSTDNTINVAKSFEAHIEHFDWIDDFAAARNYGLSKTTCDYIMWLDADDAILPENKQKLIQLKQNLNEYDTYLLPYHYAHDEYGNCIAQTYRHRIIKRRVAIWKYPIHECLIFANNYTECKLDIPITHLRSHIDISKDLGRNLRILEKALLTNKDDKRLQFYYAKELFSSCKPIESLKAFEIYINKCTDWIDNQMVALWHMAMLYTQFNQYEKAIECSMKALSKNPKAAEFYISIGNIYYNTGKWINAIPWYEMATKCPQPESTGILLLDNYTWIPYAKLYKCYAETNQAEKAYIANQKALKYRPNDTTLLNDHNRLKDIIFTNRTAERPIRLSIGSGGKFTHGYVCTDLYKSKNVKEIFPHDSIPYDTGTVHAIYSEHELEHSDNHYAAENAVKEWARVLRHGGQLTLKVPDLELCCANFLQSEDRDKLPNEKFSPREWYKYTIYGIQREIGTGDAAGQFHRTGFTKSSISKLLTNNGFRIDKITNYDGYGTPSIEVHATQINQKPKVCWLIPGTINSANASLRIRCLNIHKWMLNNNVASRIIENYRNETIFNEIKHSDVVVFVSFSEFDHKLINRLKRSGVSVVYDHCEDISGLPWQTECFTSADLLTCCSSVLADKSTGYTNTIHIPDAYEKPQNPIVHTYEPHGKDGKLRVVWCGHGGNAENVEAIRDIIEGLGMELIIISEWPTADIKWNENTWLNDLNNADIIVSPQKHWAQPAKSNTKATQAIALGIPFLGSPIKSYLEVIKHDENGFICSTPDEWKRDLEICKDQIIREIIGKAAKESVTNYSIDAVGKSWLDALHKLCINNCKPPTVDIIIPTWNNLKLLQECVKSIKENTYTNYNIIVINSGDDGTKEWLATQPDIIAANIPHRLHFSAANNIGLKISKNDYVCLLNDDTIVSEYWLNAMMHEAVKPKVGAVNPFSNCDYRWLHNELIKIDGVNLYPGMTYEQIKPIINSIYKHKHDKVVTEREWVAFYATVIPRKVIDEIGMLDEQFKSGCEDLDLCKRMRAVGYKTVTTFDSFVFHFGGSTRKRADELNRSENQNEDKQNHAYLKHKYASKQTKKIAIYTGPALESWSPDSLNSGGIGGSETCVIYVAKEFKKRGYDVSVFANCDEKAYDGVKYYPYQRIPDYLKSNELDLFISSRKYDIFSLPIKAKRKICYVHDIWLHHDATTNINQDKIDEFFCLSPWHKSFFCAHHKINPNKVYVTYDAIDHSRFNKQMQREKARLIYTSSPDRGLDILLDMVPRIKEKIPETHLHVFYGFNNWEKAVKIRNNKAELQWMDNIKHKLSMPYVTYHGRVGQDRLAEEFLRSSLWAYPSYFTETFCITAVEAMAAGLPAITTNLAALSTTVGEAGILLNGDPRSEMYQDAFINQCVSMLTDQQKWDRYSKSSIKQASKFTWENVVNDWIEHLKL